MNWFFHFIASMNGGVYLENRMLLIFYGNDNHISLQSIKEKNNMGIDVLTLPAHTTHRLQPLDASVFGLFNGARATQSYEWLVCINSYLLVGRYIT